MDQTVADFHPVSSVTVTSIITPVKSVQHSPHRPVCLTMVVNNESTTLERCLRSVIPLIDTYCICDVGSTDDTRDIIDRIMQEANVQGVIRQHHWENVEHNKTLSLLAARKQCPTGWSLVVEPNEVMMTDVQGDRREEFQTLLHNIPSHTAAIHINVQSSAERLCVFSNDRAWYYKDIVHPQLDDDHTSEYLPASWWYQCLVTIPAAGSFQEMQALEILDTINPFHLAQELRLQGVADKAQELYTQCVTSEKCAQHQRYMACVEMLNYTNDTRWAWRAIEIDASRLDAPFYAITYAVDSKQLGVFTHELIAMGMCLQNRVLLPEHTLAWEPIYEWKFSDVYGVALYWKGLYQQSAEEVLRALSKCPVEHRARLEANLKFATDALKSQ